MAVKEYVSESLGITIKVDLELCNGASECIEICPTDVYELQDGKAVAVNIDDCTECCLCVDACPQKALVHSSC